MAFAGPLANSCPCDACVQAYRLDREPLHPFYGDTYMAACDCADCRDARRAGRPSVHSMTHGEFGRHHWLHQSLGAIIGDEAGQELLAAVGETIPASWAADMLGVKPGTLRVWVHRGKLTPAHYDYDHFSDGLDGNQKVAWFRLADVLDLMKR